jgi:predicted ATPase
VQLFADRAAEAGAETDWDEQQWAAVCEICRRVDGLPLALELAAARSAALQPADIAGRLDECFRVLTGRRRGKVERHQTLRATVEWSYRLLNDDERRIFGRLAVLRGAFDDATATAVVGQGDFDAWEVTDALGSLVNKSMLAADAGRDGSTRYSMLETLRQYARERLDETGETDACRLALAQYFAAWAQEVGFTYMGPGQLSAVRQTRADLDNLRAAIISGLECGDAARHGLAIETLALLECVMRDDSDVGLEALADQAVEVLDDGAPAHRRALLTSAAYHHWDLGDAATAADYAARALAMPFEAGAVNPFEPYVAAAAIELAMGNTPEGMEALDAGRAHLSDTDRPIARALFLAGAASLEGIVDRVDQARADATEALRIATEIGCPTIIASASHGLCWALLPTEPEGALEAAERCIALYHAGATGVGGAAGVLGLAGGLHARLRHLDRALDCFHESACIARDTGTCPQLASTLDWALGSLLRAGRAEEAVVCIGALTDGALHDVSKFRPSEPRTRALARAAGLLDEATVEEAYRRGATMAYDKLADYAVAAFSAHAG